MPDKKRIDDIQATFREYHQTAAQYIDILEMRVEGFIRLLRHLEDNEPNLSEDNKKALRAHIENICIPPPPISN